MKNILIALFVLVPCLAIAQESLEYSVKFFPASINDPAYDNYNASMNDAGTRLCFVRKKRGSNFPEIWVTNLSASGEWQKPEKIYPFPEKAFKVYFQFDNKTKKYTFPDYRLGTDPDNPELDLLYTDKIVTRYPASPQDQVSRYMDIVPCKMSNDGTRITFMMCEAALGLDGSGRKGYLRSLVLQPDDTWALVEESPGQISGISDITADGTWLLPDREPYLYARNKIGEFKNQSLPGLFLFRSMVANDNSTIYTQWSDPGFFFNKYYDFKGSYTLKGYTYRVPYQRSIKKFEFREGIVTAIDRNLQQGLFHSEAAPKKIGQFTIDEPVDFDDSPEVSRGLIHPWSELPRKTTPMNRVSNEDTTPKFVRPSGKYYAIIIGVSKYDDVELNPLVRPVQDARKFADLITTRYEFGKDETIVLLDPTREQILEHFNRVRTLITPNDNLLIFYAGHGYWDESMKQGYWIPKDGKRNNQANWISNSDIKEQIRAIRSGHTLIISDACFSGGLFRTRSAEAIRRADIDIQMLYKLPSRRAMTSGTLSTVPDNSVFFEYLTKRLADNQEKFLPSTTLFDSFRRAVMNNAVMTVPQDGVITETGDEGGDFIFIRKE